MKSLATTNKHSNRYKLYIFATALLAILAIFIASWIVAQRSVSAVQKETQTSIDMTTAAAPAPGAFEPSNGFTTTATSLTQHVDNTAASSKQNEAVFMNTQDVSSVSVDVTLDSDWQDKSVEARLYGVAYSPEATASPAWPVLEFAANPSDDTDFTGFRVWNTNGDESQGWMNAPTAVNWGDTYNLKISYNATTDKYDFYIDNNLVNSTTASHDDNFDGASRSEMRALYLSAINTGTGDAVDDYSIAWSNAKYGVMTEVSDIATFPNAGDDKKVTLSTPAGTAITDTSAKEVSTKHADKGYDYPLGLVGFSYTTENSSDEISLVFVTDLKPNQVVVRKYNPTDNSYMAVDGAKVSKTKVDGKAALKVTYTIKDNGPLDLNPTVGEVTDPVGLAVSTIGVPNTGLAQQNLLPVAIIGLLAVSAVASSVMVSVKRRAANKQ